MAGKKQLPPVRIATDDDVPLEPMSLADAIAHGTRLDELYALRRIVSAHIEHPNTLAREIASLVTRQMAISKEIEELELADKPDALGKAADTDDAKFDPRAV
ncbi:hypothetical protein [Glutamicibacter sp. ZJUTW]|uniref:hypothetical protein n=1 Tax=Glutamicibacter sp. ZJUTW TaxID=1155384 RepID=UPI0011F24506|nr:hypothetical protein [Glutamicibacter sp. ZJUTW]QEP06178.1 hypothetical protein F0M17_02345 [Glutamicibacter sp. ZJUTW]